MTGSWWIDVAPAVVAGLARLAVGGLAVMLLVHAAGAALPRHPAAPRVTVWRAGVVALLVIPLAVLVPWRWSPLSPGALERVLAEVSVDRPVGLGVRSAFGTADPGAGASVPVPRGPEVEGDAGASPVVVLAGSLVLVWAGVAAGILGYFAAGLLVLRWHARRACDVTAEFRDLVPLGSGSRVLRGGPFLVPGCWGIFRPVVLLPARSARWSRARLRAVLLHELAHIRRRDTAFLLLARVACAIHWMNPLAWRLQGNLLADSEAASDAEVVARGVAPRDYARVLVDLAAEARGGRPGLALAMALPGGVSRRVVALLEAGHDPPRRRLSLLAAGLVVAASPALGTAALAVVPSQADAVVESSGRWEARLESGKGLYLELVDADGGGLSANHVALDDLPGLGSREVGAGGDVEFELVRAPGRVAFEGRFEDGSGHGSYGFTPSGEFARILRRHGVGELPPSRALLLALQGVDEAFLDDLAELTSGPLDDDLLVRASIFGVDRGFMEEMAGAGYPRLRIQDLVRLRIFEINRAYVDRLRAEGKRLSVDAMVSRRIRERNAEKEESAGRRRTGALR